MKKSIILCLIFLAFSSLTVAQAAESDGRYDAKEIVATKTPMSTANSSTLFANKNTKDKIAKCYYDNKCDFTNPPYGSQHLDFDHVIHIYKYKHPSSDLIMNDSNILDYVNDNKMYIVPILDNNNNYNGIAEFMYDSDSNKIDYYRSGNFDRFETNNYKVLLGKLALDTFVGEKVEETFYVEIPGCCITYDSGIIYKTAGGYKYVSIQGNYFDSIPNSEIKSLQALNKELIDINVDNMGNGVIKEPDKKVDDSKSDNTNIASSDAKIATTTDKSSNAKTDNSNQAKAGDSTSFLCIISGIAALCGLIKNKLK